MARLDTAANIALITVSLALSAEIGYRAFTSVAAGSRGTTAAAAPPAAGGAANRKPDEYRIGDKLGSVAGIDFASSKRSLLFVVRSGCRYCRESTAFYRRVVEAAGKNPDKIRLIALCGETTGACTSFLKEQAVSFDDVISVNTAKLRIVGTPTLLLVDSSGTVLRVWTGRLRADLEDQVLKTVTDGV